jgi:plastocyanin
MGKLLGWVVVSVLVAWGCAPGVASATDFSVTFPSGALPVQYALSSVEAGIGDTVTFGGAFASHPLVWSDGDFTTESSGTTRTYTFARGGNFAFHCAIHPTTMFGKVHVAGNQFATPTFGWAPASPETGQTVTFTVGAFADPDGTISRYEWDLDGNGSFESVGTAPTRTYASAGVVNVRMHYVDDGHEASPATTHALSVATAPVAPSPMPPTPPITPGSPLPAPGSGSGSPGAPPATPGGDGQGSSSAGTTAPRVRLGARALGFRSGRASAGVTLSVQGSATATLKRGATVLATGHASLRAGTGSIRLPLTKAGTADLRKARGHKLTATLTVNARRPGSRTTTAKRTLTVQSA